MLTSLRWLALETKSLDRAREFYEGALGLAAVGESDGEVVYAAGEHRLRVRRPSGVPRGGVHTHYAFSTPRDRYEAWWDRLSAEFDLVEHSFGQATSLYLYDPDGNCVEIGGIDEAGGAATGRADDRITGIFEVVLEVADLARAESFYRDLGFEPIDRGEERRRVRLRGPVDLELWEPQLGIADARGGLHVDLGFDGDADAAVETVGDRACEVVDLADGVRLADRDGHWLTIR